MNTSHRPQVFESLVPAPVTVAHHYVTELHPLAADAACAIAGAHLPERGLEGARTVHVGAGFGADARTALLWGAKQSVGLEQSPDQVAMGRLLQEGTEEEIRAVFAADEVTQKLYPRPLLEDVMHQILAERRELANASDPPRQAALRKCDVLADDLAEVVGDEPADALIGNIMLHWSKARGNTLAEALERFAPALRPGGVAVFSVPYHFVVSGNPRLDESLRARTLFSSPLYRRAASLLRQELSTEGAGDFSETASRAVTPLLIRDDEAAAGSPTMGFVQAQTRCFAPRRALLADVLRGSLLYEATFWTKRHGREIAPHLAAALDRAISESSTEEQHAAAATFVRFYAYRRR